MDKKKLLETEEKIRELFKQKKIWIRFHLNGGNEEESIEVFKKIKKEDWLFTNHRNHYQV
jgi:TPP-dependent pyruvate/acetoin dehydrogenase alpha subunit